MNCLMVSETLNLYSIANLIIVKTLLTASEFVSIKNNKLFTTTSLNHEMMLPGPELKVAVQCNLKLGETSQLSTKVFNISVIDRNDNSIKVQDKFVNLTLSSPYFVKVSVKTFDSYTVMSSLPRMCLALAHHFVCLLLILMSFEIQL